MKKQNIIDKHIPAHSGAENIIYEMDNAIFIVEPKYKADGENVFGILLRLMRGEVENP